jgi:hypothetical protein
MPSLKSVITNRNIFLFALFLVLVGMPMSKFLTSLGQIMLMSNWVIEGDWKRKWGIIKTSKVLWILSSFFLLHIVGLLWTSDFDYAASDLKIKMPLLGMPLLFATTKPLNKKEIDILLGFFIASTLLASIISMVVLLGWTKRKVTDIRDISVFNSHIRFALMIVLCVCILVHDYFRSEKMWKYILKSLLVAWFACFLYIMESLTGIFILGVVMAFVVLKHIKSRESKVLRYSPFIIIAVVTFYLGFIIRDEWKKYYYKVPFDYTALGKFTINGTPYQHDTTYQQTENGYRVNLYLCFPEMRSVWNKRSKIKYDSLDNKGNPLMTTLHRYLASKNLMRDSSGVASLTEEDIRRVENGATNYLYSPGSLRSRIHATIQEYNEFSRGQNFSGHSLLMRIEFWKTGVQIISDEPWLGVGTGDVKKAFDEKYRENNSRLTGKWRLRSHNQFMTITVAFGITGLIVFLIWLFAPPLLIRDKHPLFVLFFITSLLSMINEDTLETQAGVAFYGFFYCFFLFNRITPLAIGREA